MSQDRILRDLEQHFARRLRTIISDTASTCRVADVDNGETVGIVLSALIYELIRATFVMQMDEDTFVQMCEIAYRSMMPAVQREYDR
jgi:hypothetical protein